MFSLHCLLLRVNWCCVRALAPSPGVTDRADQARWCEQYDEHESESVDERSELCGLQVTEAQALSETGDRLRQERQKCGTDQGAAQAAKASENDRGQQG